MKKAYKYRIYPNKKQKEIITKTFGCCRFVYNKYLAKRIEMYEQNKETFSYVQCANDMKKLKSELEWLKEVDSTALQSSLKDLDSAYQKFFKEHVGYPKFKSKKTHRFSYKSKCVNGNIQYCDKYIKLPKLGMVKTKNKLVPIGRILNATVSQEPSGKYFVSLCCTDVEIEPFDKTGNLGRVSSEGNTLLRYKDILLIEETFSPNGIGAIPVPNIDGYKIISVSPWVKGDWSDTFALINYHGHLGEYSVSCKNLDSDNSHTWAYGALVLYAKN